MRKNKDEVLDALKELLNLAKELDLTNEENPVIYNAELAILNAQNRQKLNNKMTCINRNLLKAVKLAVHALNRKPNFPVNCIDPNIKNSYTIAAICDQAIAQAQGKG